MNTVALERPHLFGSTLYKEMRQNFDYSIVDWTIRRYNPSITIEESKSMVDAFLQWASLAPLNRTNHTVTMFVSPVEDAFHAFVLNTRLYQQFCDKFLGFFFHHDPLINEDSSGIVVLAKNTIQLLQQEFDNQLHPLLQQWVLAFERGEYKVACVGPGGHCHS